MSPSPHLGIRSRRGRLKALLIASSTYLLLVTLITHGIPRPGAEDRWTEERGRPDTSLLSSSSSSSSSFLPSRTLLESRGEGAEEAERKKEEEEEHKKIKEEEEEEKKKEEEEEEEEEGKHLRRHEEEEEEEGEERRRIEEKEEEGGGGGGGGGGTGEGETKKKKIQKNHQKHQEKSGETTENHHKHPEKSGDAEQGEQEATRETQHTHKTKAVAQAGAGAGAVSGVLRRENCTPPAIEQFPRGFMSPGARKHGGLVVHILVTAYMFLAIAIVCDEYFVPSLEMICDALSLTEDVAGATFMAAGSSAPELATSVIAVFVAKDDIGISGVIGSAVFNIMFVVSVCALFAGHIITLNWWPLIRDSTFYCLSICALLLTIYDEDVTWYESIFLLALYGLYIFMMFHNTRLEEWANTLNVPFKTATKEEKSSLFGTKPVPPVTEGGTGGGGGGAGADVEGGGGVGGGVSGGGAPAGEGVQDGAEAPRQIQPAEVEAATSKPIMAPEMKDDDYNPWEVPVGVCERLYWGISLPLVAVHHVTTPDCRRPRFRRWYLVTFAMSMVWIAVYSYLMVWMITVIGFTLGIRDTVMGLTLVAVGVSAPDALSSLCVAKQGFGDMAVSNAIGSNVFDILLCLGLPWFLRTALVYPGSVVPVESRGLLYSTISLFSTVVFLIVATHLNGWKLDKKYGVILMIWYLIFMVFASLYELNVFSDLNPPQCPSPY